MTQKQEVFKHISEQDEAALRCAISWKYGITDEQEIGRRMRRLRKTDIQELLWEYEDYNVTHEWDD